MQTASLNYKLIKKIKDDRFDEDKIHQYILLINIGVHDVQVCVIDSLDNRTLLLEDYVLPAVSSYEDLLTVTEQLYDGHAFLKAAFWKKVKISIKNNKFVQVPEALYLHDAREEYLRYNANVSDNEDCLAITNSRADATTVFAVNKGLRNWFDTAYANNPPVYMHQSASLIEGLLQFSENNREECLHLYVDRFKMHIVAVDGGKLQFYNHFVIKKTSDYIHYVMLVMKSLSRVQNSSKVFLWGYIGKNSPYYHEFYKYINNVVLGQRQKNLKFGYMFDEVQDHHFFDLYSMHLLGD